MAEESQSTPRQPGPPPWVFKNIINPSMKLILRTPLHPILSKGLAVITFTGRKSGQQFSSPVAYHVENDKVVYVFTRAKWWRNLSHPSPVMLRIKGQQFVVKPEIIQDTEAVWQLLSTYIEKYNGNYRRVGIMAPKAPNETEMRQHAADLLAIRFLLQ